MSERAGWQCSGRMERRVLDDISFWVKNLRSLNGWPLRDTKEVVYCKEGCVNMFSDVSDFQLAGARFEREKVCWDTRFKEIYLVASPNTGETCNVNQILECVFFGHPVCHPVFLNGICVFGIVRAVVGLRLAV